MAFPNRDIFTALPSELRFQIYSYLFWTENEGPIILRATRRGDWAGDMGLPSHAILLRDPRYHDYRRKANARGKWSDSIEDAFQKGDMTLCSQLPKADQLPTSCAMDWGLSAQAERGPWRA